MSGDACSAWCGWCGGCTGGRAFNAVCSECLNEFAKGRDDVGSLCDACCRRRDQRADAAEARAAQAREFRPFVIRKPQTPAA